MTSSSSSLASPAAEEGEGKAGRIGQDRGEKKEEMDTEGGGRGRLIQQVDTTTTTAAVSTSSHQLDVETHEQAAPSSTNNLLPRLVGWVPSSLVTPLPLPFTHTQTTLVDWLQLRLLKHHYCLDIVCALKLCFSKTIHGDIIKSSTLIDGHNCSFYFTPVASLPPILY